MKRSALAVLMLACVTLTSGCVGPLLVGGAAVVVADEVAEENQGGDGLF